MPAALAGFSAGSLSSPPAIPRKSPPNAVFPRHLVSAIGGIAIASV
jgi:hypothetical protein